MLAALVLAPIVLLAQGPNAITGTRLILDAVCQVDTGTGSPEGVRALPVCSIYLQTDGVTDTVLWVKEAGGSTTTGWVAKGAGGGGGAHAILSAQHTDSLANAAVRGALITGQTATPRWARLSPGASGTFVMFNGTDTTFTTNGSTLTDLNATNITTGTVAVARLGSGTPSVGTFLRGDGTWTASTVSNHNLLSATHPDTTTATPVRGDLIVSQGAGGEWTRLALGTTGHFLRSDGTDAGWSANGSALTTLNASNLSSGTVGTARLGTGTADSTTFLRGDGTWNTPSAGAVDWDDVTDPSAAQSLVMGALQTLFTWGNSTSTTNLFVIRDTSSNTGTGYLLDVGTAASSTALPFRVQAQGADMITTNANAETRFQGQYASEEHDAGNSGTSLTINWRDANQQRTVLTGNVTLTLSNPIAGGRYMIVFTQDGTGGRTVTWPAAVKWTGGVAPTITTTAGAIDICTLAYTGAGSGIYVAACNQNYQ
jgi:hypothetical protein